MSIKRTIITAIVGLTLVALVAPGVTQAVTIDELLAQITQLQAQLVALQSGGTTPAAGTGACAGVTFTRNLVVGSTGSDVKCLQSILNQSATTRVATTGAGSPGNETTYFGPLTLVAVRAYQVAQGFTPANQVGPLTRARLNLALGGTTPPVTTLPAGCTSTSGYSPTTGASCGTGVVVVTPTGAGLTVQLASNNPSAAIIVAGQGLAPLAKFTFVNGDNAAVKVTNLKLTRTGVSADADLAEIYLLQGAQRLTDSATVSSGVITFNDTTGLFTVPAGSSVEVTVASDICNTTNCTTIVGQTVGVQVASASNVTTNASSVKGNFPVSGNLMTVSNATLASVTFASSTSTPGTNTSLIPQNNYVIWQNQTVIGTRAVNMTRVAFRLIGSIYASDLQNFRLNVDGVQVGSAIQNMDADGYITFDLSSAPVSMQTGTRLIKVFADIVNGSSRTFKTAIRVAADANFVDSQYGVNIAPVTTAAATSFATAEVTTGVQTIAAGTLSVAKATNSPSGTIILESSNATIAKYTFTAAGEPVKVTDLYVYIYDSTAATYFRNGALYANGVQVGSTTSIMTNTTGTTGTHFSLGSSMIVTPGSPVTLEVRADIHEVSGTAVASGDSIYAMLVNGSTVAQDTISLGTPTVTGNLQGNTLTVGTGALTLSKYTAYASQTIVPPVTDYKLGHFTLTSSSTEATNLNTIYVDLTTNNTVETNLYVKYGTSSAMNTTTAIVTPSATAAANTWSINYVLPAGQTIDVMIYGDVSSSATTSVYTSLAVNGITANSATTVNSGATATTTLAGQTITFSTGTLNALVDGTTPANQAVSGNQEVTAAKFKLTSSNDSFTVTELKFALVGVTDNTATKIVDSGAINYLVLKDGSTVLKTVPFDSANGWFNVTGLNIAVAANTTKVLTANLALAVPYTDSTSGGVNTTGKNLAIALEYIKALNGSGVVHDAGGAPTTISSATNALINATVLSEDTTASSVKINSATSGATAYSGGNYLYVYKSVPTFTIGTVTGQGTALSAGSQTILYSLTVSAPASGPISLKQLKFPITINDVNTTTVARMGVFRFYRGSSDMTNTSSGGSAYILKDSINAAAAAPDLTAAAAATTSITTSGTADVVFYPEEVIEAGTSVTYTLRATPTGFSTTSTSGADSVTTYLATDTTPGVAVGVDTTHVFLSGDATYNTTKSDTLRQISLDTAAATATGDAANIIWSDNSAKSHDYTIAASTGDWFNGYLIKNLPLDTIGISAQ